MAYTNIDDPSAHFQAFTYTGTGTTNSITLDGNSDLQPDLYWYKTRSNSNYHYLADSSRGTTNYIYPNDSLAEGTGYTSYVQSFDTNGVTLGAGDSGTNTGGTTFANWVWKANGGTTSSNTDGSITSTVQANQDAGFSIVTYTGTGSAGTVGHGLDGKTPKFIIVKNRSDGGASGATNGNWQCWHTGFTINNSIQLNLSLSPDNAGADNGYWNNTLPTSSVFSVGYFNSVNGSTDAMIAYCFAEKQGYSKFGKYVGNGNADGTFVYTGFKPAFVLVKNASAVESWVVYDTARNTFNLTNLKLSPDTADSENNNSGIGGAAYNNIDILSNGFKCRSNNAATNGSGNTIIYMAFAENPFVTSTGIPTTAR